MLTFSTDPTRAEQQMRAIIFYLTTFGYIDGDFDASERGFVRRYIEELVRHRVETAGGALNAAVKGELVAKYTQHFHEVFEGVDKQVKELFTESVAHDENPDAFVHGRLKLRCFEIFGGFDRKSQEQLMDTIDALIMADGEAHPAEVKFRAELAALLEADLGVELEDAGLRPAVEVKPKTEVVTSAAVHPFFEPFEHPYASESDGIRKQVEGDRHVIGKTLEVLERLRAEGQGQLAGKQSVGELGGQAPFLDGHVWVCPPKPGRAYELTVLGDLHGCYSCLKAAVMQSRFFERVNAFRRDPEGQPEPKLVLLGDYIDRGIFGLNGVLRTVQLLFTNAPEFVVPLRGNHEYFVEYQGNVYGGVKPSEAIDGLRPHVSVDVFRDYIRLFDALPNMFVFDRILFVHAGIPRDRTFKEKYQDLASLNDPDLRFQMMWSDPSSADVIPAELQEQNARFAFGRLQAQRFLQKIGCHTLIRGHEKVTSGFERVYDDGNIVLLTLFSSGGAENMDLPVESTYRQVTPMALTVRYRDGQTEIVPWEIQYAPYNDPSRNAFFRGMDELAAH